MGVHRHLVRIATLLVFATDGFSQGSDLTVLTVRIENSVQYLSDVSDPLKIGTQPGVTPPAVTNFYPLITVADVTQVNGWRTSFCGAYKKGPTPPLH